MAYNVSWMWQIHKNHIKYYVKAGLHGRTQPKIAGGGQSEVQKGTLLMMMKGHISIKRKRAPVRKKGTFFHDYWGWGGAAAPPAPL